jgi:hypothetical protein
LKYPRLKRPTGVGEVCDGANFHSTAFLMVSFCLSNK